MHIVGSMWYYLVSIDQNWIPPLDFIYAGMPEVYSFWHPDTELTYRYATSLYCAVLALGGNEMGPRSDVEVIVIYLFLVILTFYNAGIFGEMTVLVQASSKKITSFQE